MTTSTGDRDGDAAAGRTKQRCALLWEEAFLWGVMARQALRDTGLPFDLLRAADIRAGELSHYRMLFVPGGWASNKIGALGAEGMETIRRFVAAGGNYLGICGGAGLATRDGLGLLPIGRKPGTQRVPSFSGPIRVATDAPLLLQGTAAPVFHAWWPSQFRIEGDDVRVIASYREAQAGAMSADIPVEVGEMQGWTTLEERYGILLDPGRLIGEPAVVEGRFGAGRVILSLLHFDTPGDPNGAAVLKNLWEEFARGNPVCPGAIPVAPAGGTIPEIPDEAWKSLAAIEAAAADWITAGEKTSLWQWRTPYLLRWRRGVRGLEASTLAVLVAEMRRHLEQCRTGPSVGETHRSGFSDPAALVAALGSIRLLIDPFTKSAKQLLAAEHVYMQTALLSPVACKEESIRFLRAELFGNGMSHDGQFKRLIDALDCLLWDLMLR